MPPTLKSYLIGVLSLNYPYTNAELLKLAKSQGFTVRVADVKSAVTAIAADITAGRIRRSEHGVLEEA